MQAVSLLPQARPINLACLAAYAREQGFRVDLLDFERNGFSEMALRKRLASFRPGFFCVSCMTPTIKPGAALCSMAKSIDKDIITVVGGSHANALPLETLREFSSFDFLVYGEGEQTLVELCSSYGRRLGRIKGLAYRKGGIPVLNRPRELLLALDTLPMPAWDLMAGKPAGGFLTKGFSNAIPSVEIYTSRGCPFSCSYCAAGSAFGRSYRKRSLGSIEAELRFLSANYAFDFLIVSDDTFTLEHKRVMSICRLFRKYRIGSWSCETRIDAVSPSLLAYMKEYGCKKVTFGIESGSPRVRRLMGKGFSDRQIYDAVTAAAEAGIQEVEGNFIIGGDISESHRDISMTERMIRSLPFTLVSVSVIIPLPGTRIFKDMFGQGLIRPPFNWDRFVMFGKKPAWRILHLSPEEMLACQKRITRSFYLSPRFIFRRLARMRSLRELASWVGYGRDYLKWYLRHG